MATATQSRLLTLARFHPRSRGRWPTTSDERFHYAATPSVAVSIYALRPGYGYCVAWINAGNDGCMYYADEADAIAWTHRAVRDMEATTR